MRLKLCWTSIPWQSISTCFYTSSERLSLCFFHRNLAESQRYGESENATFSKRLVPMSVIFQQSLSFASRFECGMEHAVNPLQIIKIINHMKKMKLKHKRVINVPKLLLYSFRQLLYSSGSLAGRGNDAPSVATRKFKP